MLIVPAISSPHPFPAPGDLTMAAAMRARIVIAIIAVLGAQTCSHAAADKSESGPGWARAAAQYLDDREAWWQGWDHANRDHGTKCVSCHTQATYALARPALHSLLGESNPSPGEKAMLADVEKRV